MKPDELRQERDKLLTIAADLVAKALPGHFGSVRFNLQDGHVVNVNIDESVRLSQKDSREQR